MSNANGRSDTAWVAALPNANATSVAGKPMRFSSSGRTQGA